MRGNGSAKHGAELGVAEVPSLLSEPKFIFEGHWSTFGHGARPDTRSAEAVVITAATEGGKGF